MPRFLATMLGTLGDIFEDGEQRVANSTQNHAGGSQSRVVTDPRVLVLKERNVEDLMRRFDSPMPPNYSEPLLGRPSIGRETRAEAAHLVGWPTKSIEVGTVDTDNGAQMPPLIGSFRTRKQEHGARDLGKTFAVDRTRIG